MKLKCADDWGLAAADLFIVLVVTDFPGLECGTGEIENRECIAQRAQGLPMRLSQLTTSESRIGNSREISGVCEASLESTKYLILKNN